MSTRAVAGHVEAGGGAAGVEGRERAAGTADRLRAALERSLGLFPERAVKDQERHLALGVGGRANVPSTGGRAVRELTREDRASGDDDQRAGAAFRRRLGILIPVWPCCVVVVTASRLAAEPPGGDHPRCDRRRTPARLAEALLVERAGDVEADVEADEVHQLERPHPKATAEAADLVDLRDRRDPLLQQLQRLEAERAVAAIDEEAGAVGGGDHILAHRLAGGAGERQRALV